VTTQSLSKCDRWKRGPCIVRVRCIRRKNIVFGSPNPVLTVSGPLATCVALSPHCLRRRNRATVSGAAPFLIYSCFATPIASIIIRCISSAPTKVFRTIASCMGRNFRSSITLAKSSAVNVCFSASTLRSSQSARPHFREQLPNPFQSWRWIVVLRHRLYELQVAFHLR